MTSAADTGTWTLGDLTVNRLAFELDVNHIDTAAFYFFLLR